MLPRPALDPTYPAAVLLAAAVAFPPLLPFAPGPSVNVVPLLFSWACMAAVLLALPDATTATAARRPSTGGLLAAGIALLAFGLQPRSTEWWATLGALACVGSALMVGRRAAELPQLACAMAWGWLIAGLLSAAAAWIQFSGMSSQFAPWVSLTSPGEAFGNLRQRNLYATLTALGLCALCWLVRTQRGQPQPVLAIMAAAVLAAGNALSVSRTGLFELLLVVGALVAWGGFRDKALRPVLLAVIPAYAAGAIGLPRLLGLDAHVDIFTRLTEGAPLCSSRSTLWANVLELIRQRPLTGWGWGELDRLHYEHLYDGVRFCGILDNAHNLPLHLAVELGLPVTFVLIAWAVAAVVRRRPWTPTSPLHQMAWTMLAVLALHSLLEYPLWYGPFQIAFGLAAGILWQAAALHPSSNPTGRAAPWRGHAQRGAALAFLLAIGAATWDYEKVRQIYLPPEQRSGFWSIDAFDLAGQCFFFRQAGQFAQLTMTTVNRENAPWVLASAQQSLSYSPEPRVIEKLVESAVMLGRDDLALAHLARYRAAFPDEHARWSESLQPPRAGNSP